MMRDLITVLAFFSFLWTIAFGSLAAYELVSGRCVIWCGPDTSQEEDR